eukprot:SM000044S15993  [mRNA]  locus=s44:477974:478957:- [translate_table: standard]
MGFLDGLPAVSSHPLVWLVIAINVLPLVALAAALLLHVFWAIWPSCGPDSSELQDEESYYRILDPVQTQSSQPILLFHNPAAGLHLHKDLEKGAISDNLVTKDRKGLGEAPEAPYQERMEQRVSDNSGCAWGAQGAGAVLVVMPPSQRVPAERSELLQYLKAVSQGAAAPVTASAGQTLAQPLLR